VGRLEIGRGERKGSELKRSDHRNNLPSSEEAHLKIRSRRKTGSPQAKKGDFLSREKSRLRGGEKTEVTRECQTKIEKEAERREGGTN